jgi:hypothetical protein
MLVETSADHGCVAIRNFGILRASIGMIYTYRTHQKKLICFGRSRMCGYKKLRNPTSEYWYDIHIPNTSEEVNMQIGSLKFNWSITVLVLYYDQNLCQPKYHMEKDGQDTTQTGRDCQTIDFSTKFNFSITVLVLYYRKLGV